MRDFRGLEIANSYRSSDCSNIGKAFIEPVLEISQSYYRAVGFFSSSCLLSISRGLKNISSKHVPGMEPSIKLIVSPMLNEQDIDAIKKGYQEKDKVIENAMMREFAEPQNEFEIERLNLLCHLISTGVLDIKVAVSRMDDECTCGMYHEKIGIMIDDNYNSIAFTGSLNESENAYSKNFESIVVFKSWDGSAALCQDTKSAFDNLWSDTTNNVNVFSFPKAVENKLFSYKRASYNPDVDNDEDNAKIKQSSIYPRIDNAILPTFPYDYQKTAINKWFEQKCCGIFDMATGTGKTFTAYGAMVKLLERSDYHLATVILVPYQHLVEQWINDSKPFHVNNIIVGYSSPKYSDYRTQLRQAVQDYNTGIKNYFYFFTTYATYKLPVIQEILSKISRNALLVADEAHNFGSGNMRNCILQNFKYRLALSATVDRYRDEEGTNQIYDYFGKKCIEYSLQQAINEKKLVPYYYYPIVVYLDSDEREEYLKLTNQLSKALIKNSNGETELSQTAEMIAIKRARLISGVKDKIVKFRTEISKHKDEKYMLVYCGTSKVTDSSNEEVSQIDEITRLLGNEFGMKVCRYTSRESEPEREIIKRRFESGDDLQALVAIKCLDEGVNIPNIRSAYLLASSTNPREYIQRRGRVLRLAKGKQFATIYDFVCLPMPSEELEGCDDKTIGSFKTLICNEVNRMDEFGQSSLNNSESDKLCDDLKCQYGMYKFDYDNDNEGISWRED